MDEMMNDLGQDIKHTSMKYEPTDDAGLKRLSGMQDVFYETAKQGSQCADSMLWRSTPNQMETKIIEIAPGVKATVIDFDGGRGALMGVMLCPHCIRRAAMYFRDLADVCDDLAKVVEDNGKVQE